MDRMMAYAELATELDRYRRMPFEELARRIDGPVVERTIEGPAGPLTTEIRVRWADSKQNAVQVAATAYGLSSWKLERLDEAIVVRRPAASLE